MQTLPAITKPKKPSKKVKAAIELLCSGECTTQKAAAARVGLSQEHLSRELSKPHVRTWMQNKARATIDKALPRAAARMSELVDSTSSHVSRDASEFILRTGHISPPPSPGVNVNIGGDVTPGYVINLTREPLGPEQARDVTPPAPNEPKTIEHQSEDGTK